MIDTTRGPFNVVLVDDPWHYNDRRRSKTRSGGGAAAHYQTIRTPELCRIPILPITAPDCMLFMWATFPNLSDALLVMKARGFRFATVAFVWIKLARNRKRIVRELRTLTTASTVEEIVAALMRIVFFGIGFYTKSNAEICLLGVRDRPVKASDFVSQVVFWPRLRHSAKPPIVRERIVELCGDVPRIELFARETAPGWRAIGDEITGRDIRDDLADIARECAVFGVMPAARATHSKLHLRRARDGQLELFEVHA